MIRIVTADNSLNFTKDFSVGLSSILYEIGYDLSIEFVSAYSTFNASQSVFDLLKLYIVVADSGVSIACAGLLLYYQPSALDECLSLLEKRAGRYTSGLNDVSLRLKNILLGDLSIFEWLGYTVSVDLYLYNPVALIDLVSSIDSTLSVANSYLKTGQMLFFVSEVVLKHTEVNILERGDIYKQWANLSFDTIPLGSSFNQILGANVYV